MLEENDANTELDSSNISNIYNSNDVRTEKQTDELRAYVEESVDFVFGFSNPHPEDDSIEEEGAPTGFDAVLTVAPRRDSALGGIQSEWDAWVRRSEKWKTNGNQDPLRDELGAYVEQEGHGAQSRICRAINISRAHLYRFLYSKVDLGGRYRAELKRFLESCAAKGDEDPPEVGQVASALEILAKDLRDH